MQKKFKATIESGRGGGAFVKVPFDVKEVFGSARPKVNATFDGHAYQGSVAPMGGVYLIGILKDIRSAIGKDVGDTVQVTLEADSAPRVVKVPADVTRSLKASGLTMVFDGMSYSHRKEHINAIEEAKKPETRARRIEKLLEDLRKRAK